MITSYACSFLHFFLLVVSTQNMCLNICVNSLFQVCCSFMKWTATVFSVYFCIFFKLFYIACHTIWSTFFSHLPMFRAFKKIKIATIFSIFFLQFENNFLQIHTPFFQLSCSFLHFFLYSSVHTKYVPAGYYFLLPCTQRVPWCHYGWVQCMDCSSVIRPFFEEEGLLLQTIMNRSGTFDKHLESFFLQRMFP